MVFLLTRSAPREVGPERVEPGPEPGELLEVGAGEGLDPSLADWGEQQPHDPLVVVVVHALDEPGGDGAVHELDDAVMAQEQVVGDLADRRRAAAVAADCEEQLVLGRRQSDLLGLVLAPSLEAAQPVAEREQALEVLVSQLPTSCRHIGER
jgi:hypothetical protein